MAVAVFATVALVTALLFVLPYFLVSERQVREEVARSILAATGVSPRIEGEVKLTLLPRPAIQLSGVEFEDGTKGIAVRVQTRAPAGRMYPAGAGQPPAAGTAPSPAPTSPGS